MIFNATRISKDFLSLLGIYFLVVQIAGCSTTITVNTKPEGAEVFADGKKIGQTPIVIDASTISKKNANGVLVRLERAGYKPVWLWAPSDHNDFDVNLNLTPFYLRSSGSALLDDHEISRADLNRLTDQMLSLQSALILGTKYDTKKLSQLVEANPTLGTAHFLAAVDKLRTKDKKDSMTHIRDAMRFAPNELDFLILFNEINGKSSEK